MLEIVGHQQRLNWKEAEYLQRYLLSYLLKQMRQTSIICMQMHVRNKTLSTSHSSIASAHKLLEGELWYIMYGCLGYGAGGGVAGRQSGRHNNKYPIMNREWYALHLLAPKQRERWDNETWNKQEEKVIDVWMNHRYLDEAPLTSGEELCISCLLTTMTIVVEVVSLFLSGPP